VTQRPVRSDASLLIGFELIITNSNTKLIRRHARNAGELLRGHLAMFKHASAIDVSCQ